MRVRLTVGLATVLGALTALSACTIKEADDGAAGSGGSSAAGSSAGGSATAGSAGTSSAGTGGTSTAGAAGAAIAGAGGAGDDPCNGISTQGQCEGNKVVSCQLPPPGDSAGVAKLVTNDCGASYTCTPDAGGASCKLKTACLPGENRCSADSKSLEVCKPDGSGFASTACGAGETCRGVPGKEAACEAAPQAGGVGADTLKGCVTFERKGMDTSGPTDIKVEPAVLQFVAVYNGNDYIGYGITGAADGCFEAQLTAPANAETTVYVFAMDFDPVTNQPLVAVAHYAGDDPDGTFPQTSTEYWNWSNKQDGCGAGLKAAVQVDKDGPGKHVLGTADHDADGVPDMLIPEVCGSGAVRIFQWTRFGMVRLGPDHYGLESFVAPDGKKKDIVTATESLKQDSIAVFWEKGKDVGCGACFLPKSLGPFHIDPPGEVDDVFQTAIYISGTEKNPTQWSYSVLSHELGHWVMSNYSLSPGEGGPHYVSQASKPGLAYSEGWATSFGQWNVSFAGAWDPLYIDTQDGTTFFVDIAKGTYRGSTALQRPDPNGGISQNINENIVAGMLFKLNADASGVDSPIAGGQGLGPDPLFKSFVSPRVTGKLNRGYSKVDLIDFFDAGRCSESISDAAISAVSDDVTFPWDSSPQCN